MKIITYNKWLTIDVKCVLRQYSSECRSNPWCIHIGYFAASAPQLPVCTKGPYGGSGGYDFNDQYSAINGPITAVRIRWGPYIYG